MPIVSSIEIGQRCPMYHSETCEVCSAVKFGLDIFGQDCIAVMSAVVIVQEDGP